jgi:hypothetical protein
LEAKNWPQVAAYKAQLHYNEMAMAAGLAIRAHIPLADDEFPNIFHLAAEGRPGSSPGLQDVMSAAGTTLTLAPTMEAEVTEYFTALIHGRHVASPTGPVDSVSTFQPDQSLFRPS